MVTSLPGSTTPGELSQAQSLILRNKEHAAFGDPRMLRTIQFLRERGFGDAQDIIRRNIQAKNKALEIKRTQNRARLEADLRQAEQRAIQQQQAVKQSKGTTRTMAITREKKASREFQNLQLINQRAEDRRLSQDLKIKLRPVKIPKEKFSITRLAGDVRSTIRREEDEKGKKHQIKIHGLQFAVPIIEGIAGATQLPAETKKLIKNPKNIVKIPKRIVKGLWSEAKEIYVLGKTSPSQALARIGGEYVLLKATGGTVKIIGKIGGKGLIKINPKYKKIKRGKITLPKAKPIKVTKIGKATRGRLPIKFPKPKTFTIKRGGTVKKIKTPIPKQVGLAGKKVTAVSVQADRLVSLLKNKKIIRKPLPGEAKLTIGTRKLLSKFDKGRISKNEFKILNRKLGVETGGQANLLERSFFADPKGRFRPSRIGKAPKDASLKDLLTGNFTWKSPKPQILIFEDIVISKFPKYLQRVARKLKAGKTLTKTETNDLLKWQSKKTGKFKPVGHLSKEPEITLAPGEIVKRKKKLGHTLINGRKVDIVRAEVVKPTKITKNLLTKSKKGTITNKELKLLTRRLKKETGFKHVLTRKKGAVKPVLRKSKLIPKRLRSTSRKVTKRPGVVRRVGRPKKIRRVGRPIRVKRVGRPIKTRAVGRPIKARAIGRPRKVRGIGRPRKAPPRRGIRKPIPRKTPPIVTPRFKKIGRVKRRVAKKPAYNVYARPLKRAGKKKKPKLIKVNKVPLHKRRAKDLRNYITDTSLSRTAQIKRTKGKPGKSRLKVPKSYARKTNYKFRTHRIVKGRRRVLPKGRVIERRKRLLDTRQEKRQITLAKRVKQITKPPMRKSIRKAPRPMKKTFNRREMLNNLAKARRVRMSNLKKKRR